MATVRRFTFKSFLLRITAALALVVATYNPHQPWSYFYWAISPILTDFGSFTIVKGFVGIVLIIGWTMFLRATFASLGAFGTLLAIAFFGTLLWLVVDQGWVSVDNRTAVSWLVLLGLAGVLGAGMSWSHIRRRLSGQLDVDETDN